MAIEIVFRLPGQMKSGKNAVQITRTGRHYPLPAFNLWRKNMFDSMLEQHVPAHQYKMRFTAHLVYSPSDRRRRDVPGMIDALWHLLERYEVIYDDCQITDVVWEHVENFDNPGLLVKLREKETV